MKEVEVLKQSPVKFDRESHTYDLDGRELKGVTPIVSWLFPETYSGIPESIMREAAKYGSMIHSACHMADVVGIAEHDSVKAYLQLKERAGLTTIANEYLVSDEKDIASSIDVVCTEKDAEGDALLDIKTTSRVHQNHLSVQLSVYAWLYQKQTGRQVGNLYCVWLPKPRYGVPALLPVTRLQGDVCEFIVQSYLRGDDNSAARQKLQDCGMVLDGNMPELTSEQIPAQYADVVDEIISTELELKSLKEREATLKDGLLQLMRENGVKKWTSDNLTLTYIAETTRKAVDSKKLQSKFPDVYSECIKESRVSDSIKITIN